MQRRTRVGSEARRRRVTTRREHAVDQHVQILALAQRRQHHVRAVEAVIQVVAETPLAHQRFERAMGGGDHAQVDRRGPGRADRQHLALGQHAQQAGLQGARHVADLVEEQRAAVGLLDQAFLALGAGAREAAGQVAEQFALDQRLGNRRAVDRHERPAAALAAAVQRLGEILLAAAGLAGDQQADGAVDEPGGARDLAVERGVATRQRGQRRGHLALGHRGAAGCAGRRAQRRRWWRCMQEQHVPPIAAQHRALIGRAALHEAAEVPDRQRQQAPDRLADQRRRPTVEHRRHPARQARLEQQLRAPVVADHAPARVERQQVVGVDVEELRRLAQPQHPVVAMALQEGGVLDVLGVDLHQLQRQVLARLGLVAAELRDVEHGVEPADGVEHRRGGAGQRDVGGVEVVVEVHRQRLAGADAGAHAAGAGVVLAPVGAQVQPGLAQAGLDNQIADEVDRDAARIGQQHHVAEAGDLLVERLQAVAGDLQEVLHLALVLAQARLRQDHGLLHARGVEPVLVHAALPAGADQGVVARRGRRRHTRVGHLHDGGHVGTLRRRVSQGGRRHDGLRKG